MTDCAGRTFWIIGASAGIGASVAHEINRRRGRLILSARDQEGLKALNLQIGGTHEVLDFDVTDKDAFAAAFKKVGKVDSVIYLAATYTPGKIADVHADDVSRTMATNIEGAFTLLRHLIPHYKAQGFGQIALCGSVAGYRGLPGGQPYSATKAAMINLAESLRAEVRAMNIDVRLINPGFVKTRMTDKNNFTMPMIINPEEAAREIVDGLCGKSFEIHFPKKFTFFMKLLRVVPYPLYFLLAEKLSR